MRFNATKTSKGKVKYFDCNYDVTDLIFSIEASVEGSIVKHISKYHFEMVRE